MRTYPNLNLGDYQVDENLKDAMINGEQAEELRDKILKVYSDNEGTNGEAVVQLLALLNEKEALSCIMLGLKQVIDNVLLDHKAAALRN